MFRLSVKEILEATGGRLICAKSKRSVYGISTDTRTIKEGDLFIALKGKNFDGHNFIGEAIKKGAAAAIVKSQFQIKDKSTLIKVRDTLSAYGDIAHYYRMKFEIPFIGITGSNGKTTAKEMLGDVLSSKFCVLKNERTENNLIGLSKALMALRSKHDIGVLELGTNHFGEIKRLAGVLKPAVGIITNIGPAHLEFLKSLSGVFKEKVELLDSLGKGGVAIINADDARLSKIKGLKCRQIRFGIDNRCDFRATGIFQESDGISFTVNDKYDFRIRVLGRHNVYNALAAITAGFLHGVGFDDVYKALMESRPQKGRLCLKRIGLVDVIDDTYNSNPESVRAAVEILAGYNTVGRKIFVCGDMLELGRQALKFHRQIGGLISKAGLDYLVTVGNFSEAVKDAAVAGGMPKETIFSCRDNRAVVEVLKNLLKEEDLLLLKGSRLLKLDEVVDALPSFISAKRDMVRV